MPLFLYLFIYLFALVETEREGSGFGPDSDGVRGDNSPREKSRSVKPIGEGQPRTRRSSKLWKKSWRKRGQANLSFLHRSQPEGRGRIPSRPPILL